MMVWNKFKQIFTHKSQHAGGVATITAREHGLQPRMLSEHAIKVTNRLSKNGYDAYLVGGCVRDLLLDKHPKDFDVATNAKPEQIKPLFKRCFLIGKRFRLAHVYFGKHVIEVATFRKEAAGKHAHQKQSQHGMLVRDNVYGRLEDDVWRRDFTVNALYYRPEDNVILDFTGGFDDLKAKTLRLIGKPADRFREDPVRMLRAIRFAAKLDLTLDPDMLDAIPALAPGLQHISPSRLLDEFSKLFLTGFGFDTYQLLQQHHLFQMLFPYTAKALDKSPKFRRLLELALKNTDQRVHEGKSVSPIFLLAVFLWQPLRARMRHQSARILIEGGAADALIKTQRQHIEIPKRIAEGMKQIWELQYLFYEQRHELRAMSLFHYPRFRAAYDLLLLRKQSGEQLAHLANWWQQLTQADNEQRKQLILTKHRAKQQQKNSSNP